MSDIHEKAQRVSRLSLDRGSVQLALGHVLDKQTRAALMLGGIGSYPISFYVSDEADRRIREFMHQVLQEEMLRMDREMAEMLR